MAVNVLVYLGWQRALIQPESTQWMLEQFSVSLGNVQAGRVWTVLTSCFSQVDVNHLLVNLLALYVFASELSSYLGARRVFGIYLVGGFWASVAHLLLSQVMGVDTPALGASGSVFAFAMLYAAFFPRRILLIGFLIPLQARWAVAGYVLYDIFGMVGSFDDGIGHAAHLGGAAYGLYVARSLQVGLGRSSK